MDDCVGERVRTDTAWRSSEVSVAGGREGGGQKTKLAYYQRSQR